MILVLLLLLNNSGIGISTGTVLLVRYPYSGIVEVFIMRQILKHVSEISTTISY